MTPTPPTHPSTPTHRGSLVRQLARRVRGPLDAALGPALGSTVQVDTQRPELVLTFDDGPHEPMTAQLAQVLAERDAHAVFFALVTRVRRSPGLVRELADAGHEVGLHGLDHRRITSLGFREADRWLARAKSELEDEVGREVRWFRPPHGAQSVQHRLLATRHGLHPVLWSGTTWDWKDVSQDERVARALADARPGAILLAHDGSADASDLASEAAAPGVDKPDLLRRVLDGLDERGLRAVTLGHALQGSHARQRLSFSA